MTQKLHKVFFTLLCAGLWERIPSEDYFPINESEWEQIYRIACMQTVEGIVYDGLIRLPVDKLPSTLLLVKWTVRIDYIERKNREMNRIINELEELFTQNNLNPCLMKGQGVAACYVNPLHRVCGDIDWYFTYTDFKKANKLISDRGICIKNEAGFSVSYIWKGVAIEHHYRMFDLHNPLLQGYSKQLVVEEDGKSGFICLEGRNIKIPSPLLMHVQVNAHILKHMLAFGIGLRQLCDSARICYMRHNINRDKLEEIYCRAGIFRWIQLLNNVMVKDLDMPSECLPFSLDEGEKADWMMEDILCSGNFGFYDKRWNTKSKPWIKREKAWKQVGRRLYRYAPYAFSEAFWFPVMQLYSYIKRGGQ